MELDFSARLEAARGGRASALGVLLEAYRPFVRLLADQQWPPDLQGKLGSSDLVQETYLEAARDFAAFRGNTEEEFVTWLKRILGHNIINLAQRYRQTEKRQLDREIPLDDPDVGANLRQTLPSREETPSKNAMHREMALAMARAFETLSADYRQVIELRHRDHLSFLEIAGRMQRSEDAVRKLWARAVEKWRQEADQAHGARPDSTYDV
jgi:RNA polymerase sigma-70 factor (ECF subfamily)